MPLAIVSQTQTRRAALVPHPAQARATSCGRSSSVCAEFGCGARCKQGGHHHHGARKQRLVRSCCCCWWQAPRGLTSVLAANSLSSAPRSRPVPKSRRLTGGGSLCSCCAGKPARRPHAPPLAAAVESPLDFRAALVRRWAEGWRISAVVIRLNPPPRTACAGGAPLTVPLRHRYVCAEQCARHLSLPRSSTPPHATIRA